MVIMITMSESEAIKRYILGEKACVSHGICLSITVGYGDLDEYGYWEFPLPKQYWPEWLKVLEEN